MAVTRVNALQALEKTRKITLSPGIFYGLKALFLHLAANKGNPDLLYLPIDGVVSASDGGNTASNPLADAAVTLYALYLKKNGATAVWFKGSNHASTATTDGTEDISFKLTTASDDMLWIFPQGHALSTGLTVTQNTTATGSTLTLSANRADGFAIVA